MLLKELVIADQDEVARRITATFPSTQGQDLGRSSIASELALQRKPNEAYSLANTIIDSRIRSSTLADVERALADADMGDSVRKDSAKFEADLDRSKVQAAIAEWRARKGEYREAHVAADECISAEDKLKAYTYILNEYAKQTNRLVAERPKSENVH